MCLIKTVGQLKPRDLIEVKGKVRRVTESSMGAVAVRYASYGKITSKVTISVTEPLYKIKKGVAIQLGDGHISVPMTFKEKARFLLVDQEDIDRMLGGAAE